MKTEEFLKKVDDQSVLKAIEAAEKLTSGEIRVFVQDGEVEDAVEEAAKQFARLGMHRTKKRNAVLLFFAPVCQKFAVFGDEGIHRVVGCGFWQGIRDHLHDELKQGDHTRAIVRAVGEIGRRLAESFPPEGDDANELSDVVERS